MTRAVELVTIAMDQLDARIEAALSRALKKDRDQLNSGGAFLSCDAAARRVKRRLVVVLAALKSGELKGKREGNRWRVRVADLDAWSAK